MQKHRSTRLLLCLLGFVVLLSTLHMFAQTEPKTAGTNSTDAILHAADLESVIPSSVFFSGQSATVQKRNSGGVRFAGGAFFFVTKVDTGGYSTSVQERYQDYLIAETAINIAGHKLAAGAYGIGFLSNKKFIVMDIGGHDIFVGDSQTDAGLSRPTPLQVLADKTPQSYRLYSGRSFVVFSRASESAQ